MRTSISLGVVAVVLWGLAGCGSAGVNAVGSQNAESLVVGPAPSITAPEQITRPIDAYILRKEEYLALHRKWEEEMNTCLGKKVYDGSMVVAKDDYVTMTQGARTRSRMYGFFDPSVVETRGFAVTGDVEPDLPPLAAPLERIEACEKSTDKKLGVKIQSVSVNYALEAGPPDPVDAPEFKAVVERWRTCMSDRGYKYNSPTEVVLDERWTHGPADAAQKATARADIDCKLKTNLVGVAVAVQTANDKVWLQANETKVKERYQALQKLLAK